MLSLGRMGDLKRRLLFLLGALIVFRIGSFIPVPGIDPDQLAELFRSQRGGILDMFNMFSGGALSRFTIFALGIMPYISASIIMQLMSVVSPTLEALKKEGESGRRKITQYTRYGTFALALFQGMGIAIAIESQRGMRHHARALQHREIDHVRCDLLEVTQPHFGGVLAQVRDEAALRQPALQRHLAALEADLVVPPGARFLPLVSAARGLAKPGADAAARALLIMGRAGSRFDVIQSHDHSHFTR